MRSYKFDFVLASIMKHMCFMKSEDFADTDDHKRGETRASTQSGYLGARARSPTLVGVPLFVKSKTNKRGTTLLYS